MFVLSGLTCHVYGQYPLPHASEASVSEVLDAPVQPDATRLRCEVEPRKPQLDFAFRFQGGYLLSCPIRVFGGNKAVVATYLRVTPQGGKPLFLTEAYNLPEMPPDMKGRTNLHKLSEEFQISGGFSLGEGDYIVELLVIDSSKRMLKKRWELRAARTRGEQTVQIAMPPLTAGPLYSRMWDGKSAADGKGLKVTILLNAAPHDPRATALRAWDRATLLDSVSTILRQIPTESVRLIAFNLDQQRELFREDRFDRSALMRLGRSLRNLELGTVSYDVLKNRGGWAEMLAGFTNDEVSAEDASDVVIFLGPTVRNAQKVPAALLSPAKVRHPHFYYFEFIPLWRRGRELPDTVTYITGSRNGTTLKIHSPGELGQAIQKLLDQTRKEQVRSNPVTSSAN